MQRAIIVGAMAIGAYIGNQFSRLFCMAGCFVGFVISHIVVLAPLIYKRYQMNQDCLQLKKDIISLFEKHHINDEHSKTFELRRAVLALNEAIMSLDLSNEKHSKASETWGRRRSLMAQCYSNLNTHLFHLESKKDEEKDPFLDTILTYWTTLDINIIKFSGKFPEEINVSYDSESTLNKGL